MKLDDQHEFNESVLRLSLYLLAGILAGTIVTILIASRCG